MSAFALKGKSRFSLLKNMDFPFNAIALSVISRTASTVSYETFSKSKEAFNPRGPWPRYLGVTYELNKADPPDTYENPEFSSIYLNLIEFT